MAMEVGVVTEDGDVRVEDGEATEVGVMAGAADDLVTKILWTWTSDTGKMIKEKHFVQSQVFCNRK